MLDLADALKLLNPEWFGEIAVTRSQFSNPVMSNWASWLFTQKESPHVYLLTTLTDGWLFKSSCSSAQAFQPLLPDKGYLLIVANY